METNFDFKRKIYKYLMKWNENPNKLPLVVDGLRQVGKSYIVNKFAKENYENVITYDFRHNKTLRNIFDGDLDVNTIIRNSSPYFLDKKFVEYKTILIFEEIGDCPLARTALKSFALDKRFSVIATGSLLGVVNYRRRNKIDIPAGYEEIVHMNSLDFEEFLWANGVDETTTNQLMDYAENKAPLPEALTNFYSEMIKRYVVIGGMPSSIKSFLLTNNYIESRKCLEGLINEYRADFGRFINNNNEEEIDFVLQSKLNKVFSSIPSQLARETENHKFKFSEIGNGCRSKQFEDAFEWLEKAGLVLRCFNLKAIEKPLEANSEKNYFKAFVSDIGLLMALYPITTTQEFLNDTLDSRKGALLENLTAIFLNKENFPLYYFSNGTDHLEIDFILENSDGIILLEEKSTNGKMSASRAVMEGKTPYKAHLCYKIIPSNFGKGEFYTSIPQYALPFLLKQFNRKLNKGTEFKPLKYPNS